MSLPEVKSRLKVSLLSPLVMVVIMWVVFFFGEITGIKFHEFGVLPRTVTGIKGIFLFPFIHGSLSHLTSNSAPLLVLGFIILYFYRESALKAILFIYAASGILVWLLARQDYHIGASGIIYGFVAFLFFSGVFKRDVKSIAIALLVIFVYGGIVWGVLPIDPRVSWEGHLFGAISGALAAYFFRGLDKSKKYDWEDDPEEYDKRDLKVRWDKTIDD